MTHVPDSLRFLIILIILAAVAYGTIWALSTYPPEQSEVIRELPSEKLRQ
jgi:hypothetical protein